MILDSPTLKSIQFMCFPYLRYFGNDVICDIFAEAFQNVTKSNKDTMDNPGVKWGIYFIIVGICWKLISYLIGADFLLGGTSQSISTVLYVIFPIFAAIGARKDNEGYGTFGEIFKPTFFTLLIGTIGVSVFFYAMWYMFPDLTSAFETIRDTALEELEEIPDGSIKDYAVEKLESSDPSSIKELLIGIGTRLVIGLIPVLIISAILKKSKTE